MRNDTMWPGLKLRAAVMLALSRQENYAAGIARELRFRGYQVSDATIHGLMRDLINDGLIEDAAGLARRGRGPKRFFRLSAMGRARSESIERAIRSLLQESG